MNKHKTVPLFLLLLTLPFNLIFSQNTNSVDKKIFAYGGQIQAEFIKYTAQLTGEKIQKFAFCQLQLTIRNDIYPIGMNYVIT